MSACFSEKYRYLKIVSNSRRFRGALLQKTLIQNTFLKTILKKNTKTLDKGYLGGIYLRPL
jgi:hypothetical protein